MGSSGVTLSLWFRIIVKRNHWWDCWRCLIVAIIILGNCILTEFVLIHGQYLNAPHFIAMVNVAWSGMNNSV